MAEVDITEQERLLTDPARSFETPIPTPDDQMREAAAAGLTAASAREVWEQTRALIMTEDFDAVSREELLDMLGSAPEDGEIVMLTANGQELNDEANARLNGLISDVVERSHTGDEIDEQIVKLGNWQMDGDGLTETRLAIASSDGAYQYAIESSYMGSDSGDLSWSEDFDTAQEAWDAGSREMYNKSMNIEDDIEIIDTSLWFQSNDDSEYRIVLGQSSDGFRWAIDDGPRDGGGDLTSISWSGQAFGEKDLALGQGMLTAREFHDLPRNTSQSIDEDEGYAL